MNRPALWVAVPFLTGIALATAPLPYAASVIAVLAAVALAYFFLRQPHNAFGPLLFFVTMAVAGAIRWEAYDAGPPGDPLARFAAARPESARFTLEGTVAQPDIVLPGSDYAQFYLRADRVTYRGTTHRLPGGVLVRWSAPGRPPFNGDRVTVTGALELDLSRVNPNTPSPEDYLRRRGIHSSVRVRGAPGVQWVENGPAWSPMYWASRFRQDLAERLVQAVPDAAAPFVLTVWLGDRRRIENETYQTFVAAGTAHILAVSGVHTGIVYVSASLLLGLMIRKRKVRAALAMIAVFAFALTAGARVASMRAAVMIALYLAAEIFDREPDAPNALGIAAFLFALVNPALLYDGGFQLSFLSIASILLFREALAAPLGRWPSTVRDGLATSVGVQLLPMPVALHLFHVLPLLAPLVNLLVVPLLGVVLWIALATSVAAYIAPPVAELLGHAATPVAAIISTLSETVAGWEPSAFFVPTPAVVAVVFYYTAIFLLWRALKGETNRAGYTAAAAGAFLFAGLAWNVRNDQTEIVFLDVGHGDATFVQTGDGKTMLIDAADASDVYDQGERTVAPFLWSRGLRRIDALVLTHDDGDHIGGVPFLLNAFNIGAVYVNPPALTKPSPAMRAILDEIKTRKIPLQTLALGDTLVLGDSEFAVLHPPRDHIFLNDNDASLVLRLDWPAGAVLLPGDVEAAAEVMLPREALRARVVKAPHHGSKTSSTEAFVTASAPETVVMSAGRRRGGKILSMAVARRYAKHGADIYRTDVHGGILITLDDDGMLIETAREQRHYPLRLFNYTN